MSTTQSPAATLPEELVSHILDLFLEDLVHNPLPERKDLFVFTKVCRTWYLASLGWTRCVVMSVEEAKVLGVTL